jgi:hypothetical protein
MTYPVRVVVESRSLMDEHAWFSQAAERSDVLVFVDTLSPLTFLDAALGARVAREVLPR